MEKYKNIYIKKRKNFTLCDGSPGGAQARPLSLGSTPMGPFDSSPLSPKRDLTDTHSSWQTSWASRGHLQLVQFFLEKKNTVIGNQIFSMRNETFSIIHNKPI